MLADALGRPLRFIVTAGQVGEITQAAALLNNQTGQAFSAIKRMTAMPCAQRSRRRRPRRSSPQTLPENLETVSYLPGISPPDQTMPTSREIITEVSGMSPNICQYCIKAVGEMPGMAEGYPTPQRLRGTWTIDPLADLS
jgi:hypothetical protein